MKPASTLVLIAGVALLTGCDDGSSSSTQSAELAEQPSSALGRSAAAGRDLGRAIEAQQSQTAGMADDLAGRSVVTLGVLEFDIPEGWERQEPSNRMRAAQLGVTTDDGDAEVTFSRARGGADLNIQRWSAQMLDATDQPSEALVETQTIHGFEVTTVEIFGTYTGGMPMGPKVRLPDYAMFAAIIDDGATDQTFVKLTGPRAVVESVADAWYEMIEGVSRR